MLSNEPPETGDELTDADRAILESLDAELGALIKSGEDGATDEQDFYSLWLGLLIGRKVVTTLDQAFAWATAIRYRYRDVCEHA